LSGEQHPEGKQERLKTNAVQWGPMGPQDLDVICRIEQGAFAEPWSRSAFMDEVVAPGACNLVARSLSEKDGQEPIGYSFFRVQLQEMHLLKLTVDPRWRRLGVGLSLLRSSCRVARLRGAELAFLEVRVSNTPAIGLYEGEGFRAIHVRPRYYRDGEGALLMSKQL